MFYKRTWDRFPTSSSFPFALPRFITGVLEVLLKLFVQEYHRSYCPPFSINSTGQSACSGCQWQKFYRAQSKSKSTNIDENELFMAFEFLNSAEARECEKPARDNQG